MQVGINTTVVRKRDKARVYAQTTSANCSAWMNYLDWSTRQLTAGMP